MKFDFNTSMAMADRLTAHINAGKPGFLALWRDGDSVILGTQRSPRPVVHLKVDFVDGPSQCRATEKDFHGLLLAGWNSDHNNVDIIWREDDDSETILLSSEGNPLSGSLLVVATTGWEQNPQTWVESIAFSHGQGALYFGSDENFVRYANTVSMLAEQLKPKMAEKVSTYAHEF